MAFNRFRPTSHFIAPHSWSNDPCGAVYIPETQDYIFCYQWNPGTTEGGNCAWGMARSKDLVSWEDCSPAIRNGTSYDCRGVFSGSIVSRIVGGRRTLFLFYTSVSVLPIHWSKDYIKGCESQSVAFSTDFGTSWHRYEGNPLLTTPPKKEATTGWRDPFVSRWERLSALLGFDHSTDYMMVASGERGHGSQLYLYQSNNLLDWKPVGIILDVKAGSKISPLGNLKFGMNFECASFFSIGSNDYLTLGVEEGQDSTRHNCRYALWLCGNLILDNGKPKFVIKSHGLLDHGIAYAPHIFRDSEGRLVQLGWADETAKPNIVTRQGWAGCLAYPRELYEISRPICTSPQGDNIWTMDTTSGRMTTLGIRPAPHIANLRQDLAPSPLCSFTAMRSSNFGMKATFSRLSGNEIFEFHVRKSPCAGEVTKIVLDIRKSRIIVDRSHSSLEKFGTSSSDSGSFLLLPNEDLHVQIFVDNSVLEVYANDRFALTSRVYPSFKDSIGVSYEFGGFDEGKVRFECWESLKNAWPIRDQREENILEGLHPRCDIKNEKLGIDTTHVSGEAVPSA